FVDAGFGDGVDSAVIAAETAGDRADRDDPAVLPLHHLRGHLLAAEDARKQVAIQHGADVGQRNADAIVGVGPAAAANARAAGADVAAGIRHENINAAEAGSDGVGHALYFFFIRDVTPDRHRRAAGGFCHVLGDLLHRVAFAERFR